MKRFVPILVVLGMLVGGNLPVAQARIHGERTESGTYAGVSWPLLPDEYQGFRVNGWIARCDQTAGVGCVRFEPSGQDRYATIDIADASGRPIGYYAYQYMNGHVRGYGRACGAISHTFPVKVGYYLEIYVLPSGGGPCAPSVPTTGTVTVTFSTTKGDNS
jgi:hypothetical protein